MTGLAWKSGVLFVVVPPGAKSSRFAGGAGGALHACRLAGPFDFFSVIIAAFAKGAGRFFLGFRRGAVFLAGSAVSFFCVLCGETGFVDACAQGRVFENN